MSKIASFLLGACCMLVAGALVVFSYPWTGNTWMGSASMVSDGRPRIRSAIAGWRALRQGG